MMNTVDNFCWTHVSPFLEHTQGTSDLSVCSILRKNNLSSSSFHKRTDKKCHIIYGNQFECVALQKSTAFESLVVVNKDCSKSGLNSDDEQRDSSDNPLTEQSSDLLNQPVDLSRHCQDNHSLANQSEPLLLQPSSAHPPVVGSSGHCPVDQLLVNPSGTILLQQPSVHPHPGFDNYGRYIYRMDDSDTIAPAPGSKKGTADEERKKRVILRAKRKDPTKQSRSFRQQSESANLMDTAESKLNTSSVASTNPMDHIFKRPEGPLPPMLTFFESRSKFGVPSSSTSYGDIFGPRRDPTRESILGSNNPLRYQSTGRLPLCDPLVFPKSSEIYEFSDDIEYSPDVIGLQERLAVAAPYVCSEDNTSMDNLNSEIEQLALDSDFNFSVSEVPEGRRAPVADLFRKDTNDSDDEAPKSNYITSVPILKPKPKLKSFTNFALSDGAIIVPGVRPEGSVGKGGLLPEDDSSHEKLESPMDADDEIVKITGSSRTGAFTAVTSSNVADFVGTSAFVPVSSSNVFDKQMEVARSDGSKSGNDHPGSHTTPVLQIEQSMQSAFSPFPRTDIMCRPHSTLPYIDDRNKMNEEDDEDL